MKHLLQTFTLILIFSAILISCDKNENPEITMHELGYENNKTVVAGSDLHIDAEILAPLKIAQIQLIIHSEKEHEYVTAQNSPSISGNSAVWEIDSIYRSGYTGVKNTNFHEHIAVPSSVLPGHYHLHLKVTDMDGNQTIKEDEIEVLDEH
ncbi:MAG: DUF4625 domain-containing protein [Paludibacteraceae bacterium]|nr:DUF4625 domain-containing protein [Paludibacteraceae bacterium]